MNGSTTIVVRRNLKVTMKYHHLVKELAPKEQSTKKQQKQDIPLKILV